MLSIDIHTHTIAGGHGTTDTIADLAKAAYRKGMTLLGISDHGPATPGSCKEPYFRSLLHAPRNRADIQLLYGAEVNILDEHGHLDLPDDILMGLDYAIAAIHPPSYHCQAYRPASFWDRHPVTDNPEAARRYNTQAYIRAMENPAVTIIGHPDDVRYPIDHEQFAEAAAHHHIIIEVNEASIAPGGYRGTPRETMANMASLLLHLSSHRVPILLSSDSHGAAGVGEAPCAETLVTHAQYPRELILNHLPADEFVTYLRRRKDPS